MFAKWLVFGFALLGRDLGTLQQQALPPAAPPATQAAVEPAGFAGSLSILGMPTVLKELRCGEEQRRLLGEAGADLRQRLTKESTAYFQWVIRSPGASQGERQTRRDAMQAAIAKLTQSGEQIVEAILEMEQLKRLGQLRLQFEGLERLATRDDLAERIGISPEQRRQIGKLIDDSKRTRDIAAPKTSAAPAAFLGFSEGAPTEEFTDPATQCVRDRELRKRILAALTETQRARWSALIGRPFEFPMPPSTALPPISIPKYDDDTPAESPVRT